MKWSVKTNNLVLVFISMGLAVASFAFQYLGDLPPCPLCIMQRAMVLLLFLLSVSSLFLSKLNGLRLLSVFQILACLGGVFFASRQVYLQSLPADQAPACGPGLNFMLQYMPLREILHALFYGSGDCAEVHWRFLGLTMPMWTLAFFVLLLCLSAYNLRLFFADKR